MLTHDESLEVLALGLEIVGFDAKLFVARIRHHVLELAVECHAIGPFLLQWTILINIDYKNDQNGYLPPKSVAWFERQTDEVRLCRPPRPAFVA